jgi:glycosyltransferase involved in cell wall biosynthesis
MIAAVVPAYNAAPTLKPLLGELAHYIAKEDIVVVDDGSTDETGAVAGKAGVRVIRHDRNRGKGAALRSGFESIQRQQRYEAVLTIDADLQHSPKDIPTFLEAWERGTFDMLIGYRRKIGTRMPLHRMLSNSITSLLVSARTGRMIKDSQSGFRLISSSVLSSMVMESEGFEAETEVLIRAALRGFRIGFVPIATIYSDAGSHMTHWQTTKKFLSVLLKEY